MTTVAISQALVLGLALFFVPLSLVWAYALFDSLRCAVAGRRGRADAAADSLSWPALLLLTGFFGGVAYLCLVLLPRLHKPRARLRLRAASAA